jgi:hypothetical protein
VTSFVITQKVKDFAVFGAGRALVFALPGWLVLIILFRRTERDAQAG